MRKESKNVYSVFLWRRVTMAFGEVSIYVTVVAGDY
jgi:hypothetical protein